MVVIGVEIGPLSRPVVTSYRLLIVTIDLSLTVFAVLRLLTERQKDNGIGLAKGGICTNVECVGCQKFVQNI